jgi:hypothetical protein
MTSYDHFLRLLVFIGFVLLGVMVTVALSGLFLISSGISYVDISRLSEEGINELPAGMIRVLLAIQHIGMFIIPAVTFGFITYKSGIWQQFDLEKFPTLKLAILGIAFLLIAYPLVNLSFLLNESIPLPSWAGDYENQAEETLMKILQMDSPLLFIVNLLLIAVLPGIGEELLFRGIVQKHLGGWIRNPIAAIWITAIIFSMIHMQFEGFFPRLVLGAILGYLYYWTNNLWVPIITHAFNNGIQVALIYSMGIDVSTFEQEGSDQLQWWMIPLSVIAMYVFYTLILKNRDKA